MCNQAVIPGKSLNTLSDHNTIGTQQSHTRFHLHQWSLATVAGQRSTTGIKTLKTKTTDIHKFYISAKQEITGANQNRKAVSQGGWQLLCDLPFTAHCCANCDQYYHETIVLEWQSLVWHTLSTHMKLLCHINTVIMWSNGVCNVQLRLGIVKQLSY